VLAPLWLNGLARALPNRFQRRAPAGGCKRWGLRDPAPLWTIRRPPWRLDRHGRAGGQVERASVVRDPQQHGGALLEGVGVPARPQEEQPKVKA
jgi:hypothetical protein